MALSTRSRRSGAVAQKISIALAIVLVIGFLAYRGALRPILPSGTAATPRMVYSVVPDVAATATASAVVSVTASPTVTVAVVVRSVPPPPAALTGTSVILSAMNARRSEAGVAALRSLPVLQDAAQRHADDMAGRGYFSHTDPDGVTFQQRIAAIGYGGTAVAENLGLTSAAAVDVIDGWMDSPAHRTNLLNGTYTVVGIGIARGTWQGVAVTFVVAIFGNTDS